MLCRLQRGKKSKAYRWKRFPLASKWWLISINDGLRCLWLDCSSDKCLGIQKKISGSQFRLGVVTGNEGNRRDQGKGRSKEFLGSDSRAKRQ